jgi:hypothetical protein
MLEKLTAEDFTQFLDEKFAIQLDQTEDGGNVQVLSLTLVEVSSLGDAPRDSENRQPFSILFLGPNEPILQQKIYTLRHEKMRELPLFLVPLGPRDQGIIYEAVFT